MFTHGITETRKYCRFTFCIFRKDIGQEHFTFSSIEATKGLPEQTLKVVEDAARDRLGELVDGWDTRTMNAQISVYKVRTCICS